MNLTEPQTKMVIWAVAFTGVVVLIALGKLPAEALQYALLYAAGSFGGGLKLPGQSQPGNASNDQPGASK